jgi:hypothetical protein
MDFEGRGELYLGNSFYHPAPKCNRYKSNKALGIFQGKSAAHQSSDQLCIIFVSGVYEKSD